MIPDYKSRYSGPIGWCRKTLDRWKFNKTVPIICMTCGLLKSVGPLGAYTWWPKKGYKPRRRCVKGGEVWQSGSHGICPVCAAKYLEARHP